MERELQLLQDKNKRLEKEVADLLNELSLVKKENKQLREKNNELENEDSELVELLIKANKEADNLGKNIKEATAIVEVSSK